MGKYFSDNKYPTVETFEDVGTNFVYETRDVDNQGHVWVYSNGQFYGNGLYNWQ